MILDCLSYCTIQLQLKLLYSLGNGPLFYGQNDTVFALDADHRRSSTDCLHGVFDLQQVSVGTKDGNGTIVGHVAVAVLFAVTVS